MAATVLHTNPMLPAIEKPNSGHGPDYARFLDCIHCGLCLSACPTYEELGTEMDGPRGRIHLMRAVVDGRLLPDTAVRKHLDLCLDCRACETACPSGVRYHEILEPFRASVAQTLPPAPLPWPIRFALKNIFPFRKRNRLTLAPARLWQRLGLGRLCLSRFAPKSHRTLAEMLPRLHRHHGTLPEVMPAEGKRRARVALFLGCVADAVYPRTNLATARVLQRNGCEVWIPLSQVCCGALDYHGHTEARAHQFGRTNLEVFGFGSEDVPPFDALIVNAAGCGAMLKDYPLMFRDTQQSESARKLASKTRDIHEFLMELCPIKPTHSLNLKATYHDACHLRHGQQIYEQPRHLLKLIPGLELVPLPESELCCGAAGSYNLTQPEMADRLGARKAERIFATGAQAVFTGNVGCLMQVTKHLRRHRPDFVVAHPIDALWASYSGESLP